MSCDEYLAALTEVALGAPMPGALEAHLPHCDRCGAYLAAHRLLLEKIDTEVQAALQVAPSERFADRTRRVGAGSSRGWPLWLLPGAAVAAAVIVLLRPVSAPPGPRPGTERPAVPQTPAGVVAPAPAVSRTVPPEDPPGLVRPPLRPPARRAEPEVLIAAGPRAALGRYVESLRRWRAGAAPVLAGDIEARRPISIEVTPVELASIDVGAASKVEIDPIRFASIDVEPFTMESATKE